MSPASDISYLIFIGSFDLCCHKLLVNGQVKSDSFGVTVAKLSYKYGLLRTSQIQEFCF